MTFTRTFRRFVLPIAWLLIGATIAVSLAVLAFGGGATGAEGTESPTAVSLSPTIAVERATLENSLEIDGTIVIDPAVPVKTSVDGTLTHVHVPNGARVSKGDPLFEVRTVVEPAVATEDEDDEPAAPVVRFVAVTAPVSGRLAGFTGKVGDEVTGDTATARIKRSTFTARGTVPVVDRYRLMDAPDEAKVTIDGGPEPFTCTDLQIADEGVEGAGVPTEEGEEPESSSAAEVVCDVPEDVTVFDGLELSMQIDAGSAQDALVVPVTAVRGLLERGTVWVVDDSGEQTERRVRLGVNDGKSVEILKGLKEGAQILQYVPGSPTDGNDGESEAGV
ncbi:efflux RND transporter periplasmic adaptor subunit [Aeromicrobium duanguangcaii]|uniref:Biotin/lipoyl-binding protein n=1 Tax=Aeromicrobium duanguangcaii TaxID=2968086 RepID=A0ABY5KFQ5_9ACTN|nr:biotin/lipoyl-binding protein [Aeromicrobium duanguangcaii]MCD9154701.1 biotin/lipoyl-binding protein [Aeromicrobium duanguangcaii]UUI67885.1 biotin/lipoyl-binding protein [Aeromicrobium duanguangcaii]